MTYFQWELDVLHWFQGIHNPILDQLMVGITMLGSAGIFWILLSFGMLIFGKDKKVGWTSLLALFLSALVVNLALKNVVGRDRPCWIDETVTLLVKRPSDYSFPSGHSSASFAAAIAIVQYSKYRMQGIAAIILATLIAVSRLYLFVHWPTDVLAGMILGIVEGILAGMIVRYVYTKKVQK